MGVRLGAPGLTLFTHWVSVKKVFSYLASLASLLCGWSLGVGVGVGGEDDWALAVPWKKSDPLILGNSASFIFAKYIPSNYLFS